MTDLTEKELAKWKSSFAEMGIIYETNDEYRDAVHNLVGYFDVLIQMDLQDKQARKNASA